MALSSRPELAQSRIQLAEPAVDHQGIEERAAAHPGRGGEHEQRRAGGRSEPAAGACPARRTPTLPFFIGGYGTVLSQLFARNFPNYAVGFNLNIPIRNRAAQAQVASDELTYRQQQLGLQRLENQVRVDVQNAVIGVSQARAQYHRGAEGAGAAGADAGRGEEEARAGRVHDLQRDSGRARSGDGAVERGGGAKPPMPGRKWNSTAPPARFFTTTTCLWTRLYKGVVSRPPSAIPVTPPTAGAAPAAIVGSVREHEVDTAHANFAYTRFMHAIARMQQSGMISTGFAVWRGNCSLSGVTKFKQALGETIDPRFPTSRL